MDEIKYLIPLIFVFLFVAFKKLTGRKTNKKSKNKIYKEYIDKAKNYYIQEDFNKSLMSFRQAQKIKSLSSENEKIYLKISGKVEDRERILSSLQDKDIYYAFSSLIAQGIKITRDVYESPPFSKFDISEVIEGEAVVRDIYEILMSAGRYEYTKNQYEENMLIAKSEIIKKYPFVKDNSISRLENKVLYMWAK